MANTNTNWEPSVIVHTPQESAGVVSRPSSDNSDTSSTFSAVTAPALDVGGSDTIVITVIPPDESPRTSPANVAPAIHVLEGSAMAQGQSRPSSLSSKRVRFEVESDFEDDSLSGANPDSNGWRSRRSSRPPSILRSETDTHSVRSQSGQSVHFAPLPPSRIIETASISQSRDDASMLARKSADGWSGLDEAVRGFDDKKIRVYKEDMDTLLVFAGLFSAVLTAFNVESYKSLQRDSGDVSVFLLLQMSQQMASFAINSGYINATHTPISLPSFQPTPTSVRVNAYWFASLILSLVAASMAILVKQWLREYPAVEITSPQQYIRIRHFRYVGLVKWHVFEIASALPILLQIALVLFFLGLGDFTRNLHPVVGWIVTSLIVAWLTVYATTTLMPIFSSRCPYKTPLIRGALQRIHRLIFTQLGDFFQKEWSILYHDESVIVQNPESDVSILANFCANYWTDQGVLGNIRECLSVVCADDVVSWMQDVSKQLGHPLSDSMEAPGILCLGHPGSTTTMHILVEALKRELVALGKRDTHPSRLSNEVRMALQWVMRHGEDFPEIADSVGTLVSTYLSHSQYVAEDIVQSFWGDQTLFHLEPDAPSWFYSTRVMWGALSAVQSIMSHEERKDPLRLCFALLFMARRANIDIMKGLQPIFRPQIDHLVSSIIPESITLEFGYNINSLAYTCVNLAEQLKSSLPGLVSDEVVARLGDLASGINWQAALASPSARPRGDGLLP